MDRDFNSFHVAWKTLQPTFNRTWFDCHAWNRVRVVVAYTRRCLIQPSLIHHQFGKPLLSRNHPPLLLPSRAGARTSATRVPMLPRRLPAPRGLSKLPRLHLPSNSRTVHHFPRPCYFTIVSSCSRRDRGPIRTPPACQRSCKIASVEATLGVCYAKLHILSRPRLAPSKPLAFVATPRGSSASGPTSCVGCRSLAQPL